MEIKHCPMNSLKTNLFLTILQKYHSFLLINQNLNGIFIQDSSYCFKTLSMIIYFIKHFENLHFLFVISLIKNLNNHH
jgi:hypothetical protein